MANLVPQTLLLLVLSGTLVLCGSELCTYDEAQASDYVLCTSITQRPPYACASNGGLGEDESQIHILETDLDGVLNYNESSLPEIAVVVKPWSSFPLGSSQTIILVFHAFKPVVWKVFSDPFPLGTKFIIKSSFQLHIDPSSVLFKTPVEMITILPKDSESVILTIESLFGQRVTTFNGFHDASSIMWSVGPGEAKDDAPCRINPLSLNNKVQIFKEIPVPTSGCTVTPSLGYSTHIIDIVTTSKFPLVKHSATLTVRSKMYKEEFYGSNVVIILKSKATIEWKIDTSGMDGRVMVVTNGRSATPSQTNLNVNTLGFEGLPDIPPQEFIDYVSTTYGGVASYTKADIANHIVIEVPEVVIAPSHNTTDMPTPDVPLPNMEEIIAAVDGQKSVNCYREKVTVSWPLLLLDELFVEEVYFSVDSEFEDCSLQMIASQGTLLSGYDQCGFTAEKGVFSSLYTSKITVLLKGGGSQEIGVQCRIYNTSLISHTDITTLYKLSIFDTSDYETSIKSYSVPENGYVYFQAELKEIEDPNMSAVVEECFLSPTQDNILDRHVLISQTCKLDSSIHFLNQNIIGQREGPSQKIKFQINRYFVTSKEYYLHCKVSMCSKKITPDIPLCTVLVNRCKRDPPDTYTELEHGYEETYILAGPITLQNSSGGYEVENGTTPVAPCKPGKEDGATPRGRTSISMGLLIGIALGSFALGIIITVFTIHCVSLTKSRTKVPPTDVYRFENRQVDNLYEPHSQSHLYEPIKLYDVAPQGHHLNRTNTEPASEPPV